MAITKLAARGIDTLPTGSVLQVILSKNTYGVDAASTTLSDIESSSGVVWEPAITPSSTSSKILVLANIDWYTPGSDTTTEQRVYFNIHMQIGAGAYAKQEEVARTGLYFFSSTRLNQSNFYQPFDLLLSPSTTDEVKFKFERKSLATSGYSLTVNDQHSTCTLMEVVG